MHPCFFANKAYGFTNGNMRLLTLQAAWQRGYRSSRLGQSLEHHWSASATSESCYECMSPFLALLAQQLLVDYPEAHLYQRNHGNLSHCFCATEISTKSSHILEGRQNREHEAPAA